MAGSPWSPCIVGSNFLFGVRGMTPGLLRRNRGPGVFACGDDRVLDWY